MKRGQPQCVLSVDVSTCGTQFFREGDGEEPGMGPGSLDGLEPDLDQGPGIARWMRRKRLLPQVPPGHTFQRPRSPDISSNWRMGTSPT